MSDYSGSQKGDLISGNQPVLRGSSERHWSIWQGMTHIQSSGSVQWFSVPQGQWIMCANHVPKLMQQCFSFKGMCSHPRNWDGITVNFLHQNNLLPLPLHATQSTREYVDNFKLVCTPHLSSHHVFVSSRHSHGHIDGHATCPLPICIRWVCNNTLLDSIVS